ncbi:hypothetical protein [Streptomyces dangxiongensis]|uniref:hypothetical protein n=1 Tax=Streptomyces dangxiongensis TaxID=1442032 RepID=UPI003743F689
MLGARLRRPSVRTVGLLAMAGALLQAVAGLSPSLAVLLLVLVLPMAVVESLSDTAGTAVLQTDPPPRLRGRVLGVWSSVGTWSLGGPPLLGLLMEWPGLAAPGRGRADRRRVDRRGPAGRRRGEPVPVPGTLTLTARDSDVTGRALPSTAAERPRPASRRPAVRVRVPGHGSRPGRWYTWKA